MEISGKTVNLAKQAMHVAPGGSLIYTLTGPARTVGALLSELREEIAWGLADAADNGDGSVRIAAYFGAADEDVFKDVCSRIPDAASIKMDRVEVAESEKRDAYTMASRNQVVNALL